MLDSQRFRAQCRWLRRASLGVLVGLGGVFLTGVAGAPWLIPARGLTDPAVRSLLMAVLALPAAGYLWALWAAQQALGDLAAGRMFHLTVARAMRRMGAGVLIGALLSVFAVTNLSRWITGGQGSYLYFDLSGIVLGVVGAALILLARLIDQARALQAELDEIV
jgi:hypothetical protein